MFDVWKSVLAKIEQSVSREEFSTWFTGAELVEMNDSVITIGAPNVFKINQLKMKYFDRIKEAFKQSEVEVTEINFIVHSNTKPKVQAREITATEAMMATATAAPTPTISSNRLQAGLNPKYTLDNFVIGSNNELAVSIAQNIVDRPGERYNPFFLYGGPGLGKTHLVQAIGNALLARDSRIKLLYLPMSNFYSDFINSIKNKKGDEFHQKFKKLDVLIIDDFQMIVNKDASQAEFFDIFNELHQLNKQIIITCDRLPEQIKTIDERLSSRLRWCGTWDLQMPQFEDKCAILKSKAEFKGVEVEDAAIEYLAENVRTNIRDLEGEFERLLAMAYFKKMTPLEVINDNYFNMSRAASPRSVSAKQVVEQVAKFYQLSVKEMCGKSRVAHIKNARQVAMYMLAKELGMSQPKIALEVGVKDHTTVLHGVRKIENDLKLNFVLRDQIAALREKMYV